jgi:hypothetical protein
LFAGWLVLDAIQGTLTRAQEAIEGKLQEGGRDRKVA